MRHHPPSHPIVKCSKPLAANASAAPLDVVKMKSALGALGHYEAPEWGVSQFPDAALFDAIKAFQKSQGLKADGAIKPDGETEAALSQAMTPRRAATALQATAQALQSLGRGGDELLAHITKEEAALLHNVTDGATINPQTGLLEFWHDYEGEAAGVGSSSQNTGPDATDDGRGQGSGPNDYEYEAYNSKPSGPPGKRDGFGDSGNGAKGGSVNGQSVDGKGLMGAAQKEDATKTQVGRSTRVAGRQTGINSLTEGFLDTNTPEDEDAQDWNSSLLGEEAPAAPNSKAPTADPNAPKDANPNPAPKSNNGGQNKNEFSFFGNLAEDVRSILNGTAQGPHSQYDKRNAEAMADKYGVTGKDRTKPFLRGGEYGPGGGSYNPSELHNAGLGYRGGANAPQENRQRMADIYKDRQRARLAAARMKELDRIRAAQALGAPKDLLDRRAPTSGSLMPQDGPVGRTPAQKAADVGEQSMALQTAGHRKGPTPVPDGQKTGMELMGSVGQNGLNDPKDVAALQNALVAGGHMNVLNATGWINAPTVEGIKGLQKGLGLPTTGTVNPFGQTEEALAAVDSFAGYSMDEHGNWYDPQGRNVPSPYVNGNLQLASQQTVTLDLDIPAKHRAVYDQAARIGIPSELIDPTIEFDRALVESHQQLGMKTVAERKVAKHLYEQAGELGKTDARYEAIHEAMKMAKAKSLTFAADAGSFGYMSDEQLAKLDSWYNPNSWGINPFSYSVALRDEIYHREYLNASEVERLAMGWGVTLSKEAKADPKAKMGLVQAKTYRYQTPLEQNKTMQTIYELAEKYTEFGPGGVYGNISVSINQPEKELWSMNEQELKDTLEDNKNTLSVLKGVSAGEFGKNLAKLGAGTFMSTTLNLAGVKRRIEATNKKIEHMLAYPSD